MDSPLSLRCSRAACPGRIPSPRLYKRRANACHSGSPTESPPTSPSATRNLHLAYKQIGTRLPTVEQQIAEIIFGHAQSGLISPSEWRLLNRYRPGRGWRLSSVTALELLVGLDNLTTENKFQNFRKRVEPAVNLSNGRVFEEPRLLICRDVLKIPFPLASHGFRLSRWDSTCK